jgi:hypothetical protein
MVEFAIAAASFTLIADECLYNKCHTQATRDCRKAFSDAYTMAKNLRKNLDAIRPSPWLDLRYKTKTAQTDTSGQLKDRQLFPSPYATTVFESATKAGFEEGYEYEILIYLAKQYLEDVEPSHPQYMAWLDMGVAKMNDLIRYTDITTILAADTVAFCCFIDTIEGVLPKYKIDEFQEDYEGRCTIGEVFQLSDTEWTFANLPRNYRRVYDACTVLQLKRFRQSQHL